MMIDLAVLGEWLRWGLISVLTIGCWGAIWFYGCAIYGAWQWSQLTPVIQPNFAPPVTILKPLCGLDRDTYENLTSFCQQNYPTYQIIFAVREADDPCVAIVQKLIRLSPDLDLQLVIDDRDIGANPKVNNLANAVRYAKYDVLVIADSDIRVESDYLRQIVQPLRHPLVGVVTCPYRSLARNTVARFEALGTATDFHAGVLVAQQLEGLTFALGATIVLRQSVLANIGGFAAIADYLADDYQLGYLPAAAGYQVVLSSYVVEHVIGPSAWWASLRRQIRWARGTRASRPAGYMGLVMTQGTVSSLLLVAIAGSSLSLVMLGITWAMRLAMGLVVGGGVLGDRTTQGFWWLIPVRDLMSFGVWLAGFWGNQVEWRGQWLDLLPGGKLQPKSAIKAALSNR
jgi:ceramide glucosyltransferase